VKILPLNEAVWKKNLFHAEQIRDTIDVIGRNPNPSWMSQDVTVALAGVTNRRRVDDWQKFGDVFDENPVKQRLVTVVQRS
jgi:hypothetical protein